MKTKYYFHGRPQDLKYPKILDSIVETFEVVEKLKVSRYFHKPKVHIYPKGVDGHSPKNFAFLKLTPDNSPEFHFGIGALNMEYKLEPFIFSRITRSPVFNECHATRAAAAHEIGHWIFFCSLAKLPQYGGSPQLVSLMNNHYYQSVDHTKSDYHQQMEYRDIFPERWADRLARVILSKMRDGGRSKHVELRKIHVRGL